MRRIDLPLLLLLATAPALSQAETIHGYEIEDRHRWLETEEGAKGWIEEQNAATKRFFSSLGGDREATVRRLDELSKVGGIQRPKVVGDRTFYVKRTGEQEQWTLYVREKDGRERMLVDPAAHDASGKVALDWYHVSPSGKLVAYGLSRDGSEDSVLHLLEVDTGRDRADRIPNTRHTTVAWLPDESGFYYVRYPEGDRYHRHVYLHRLGDDPARDRYVFGKENGKTDWVDVRSADGGKRIFVEVAKGWSVSEIWMMEPGGAPKKIVGAELQALFGAPFWIDGRIVTSTNHQAPNFRVVAIDPKKPEPKHWKTLVPEGDWPIEGMEYVGGKLAVARLVKAVSRLEIYGADGTPAGEVALPGIGSISALEAEAEGQRLVVGFSSFLTPAGLYEVVLPERTLRELATVPAPKLEGIVVEQVEYPSYDGTRVPMFLIHHEQAARDGSNPTLLTGYGGFNISIKPGFSAFAVHWVERGGVYAVANLRGGSEMGEAWHEAGRREHKHQVFRDFEYAMRHLIRTGWTRPARLAITGGSNGGLLMGAMMTQAPELFRACVGRVGLYDMVRYHRWPPAELWVDEYGSADDPEQIGYLLGYSPYHQVLPGVAYPAFLGLTALADTRVTWIHTAKFVAALQEATAGKAPILFFREEKAGHGAGKGRTDRVKEEAMMYDFIVSQLAFDRQKLVMPPAR